MIDRLVERHYIATAVEVIRNLSDLSSLTRSVVTVGNFDGVHVGHQGVLNRTLMLAREISGRSVVLTFVPHPVRVLAPGREPARLTPLERKLELIAKRNIDVTLVLPFDRRLGFMEPQRFANDILVQGAGAKIVIVGKGFRFGRDRAGDIDLLRTLGPDLGFSVESFGPVELEGSTVSSTRIRQALLDGDVKLARLLLGRPHDVGGVVVTGDRRGREIGFPTANLGGLRALLPSTGVYACWASVGGRRWMSAVNIGDRPTFGRGRSVEAFLLDFQGDLYNREISLAFIARLRSNCKFDGVDALVKQIEIDVSKTREVLHRDELS